jgi:hypothetical protein
MSPYQIFMPTPSGLLLIAIKPKVKDRLDAAAIL